MNLLSQKSSDRERLRQQEAIVKRQEKEKKEEEVLSDDEYDKYIGRVLKVPFICVLVINVKKRRRRLISFYN